MNSNITSIMWNTIETFVDEKEHVTKFLFSGSDIAVEAVLYRYPTYEERTVLCISTMCGCPMGCRFCGTGDYFVRSLTADEIVAQVDYILSSQIGGIDPSQIKKLQIMVMSMGEPMLNKALDPAFTVLHDRYPNAALLISTSGPAVDYSWVIELSKRIPTVGLQFSVHESTDEARNALIPFEKKLSLKEIAEVGTRWFEATRRKPFFNYCAHDNNVNELDASRLHVLFNPEVWEATVSVICEQEEGREARNQHQRELAVNFGNILLGFGFNVRVFDPAGQDTIGGGCGQLHRYQEWIAAHPELAKPSCGNGKDKVHIPIKVVGCAA